MSEKRQTLPKYASIGNGLYVRVGKPKKKTAYQEMLDRMRLYSK